MATEVKLTSNKTYATKANMEKAIAKYPRVSDDPDLRYLTMVDENGRYYPVFLGERAIQAGVHFLFCVAG